MKKLFASFAIVALGVFLASPAGAFTTYVGNINDDSSVTTKATWSLVLRVENHNSAVVTNHVSSSANSGYNAIISADDMENVSIVTGDTDAASLADTTANTNSIEEDLNGSSDGDTTVENIDDSSDVEVEISDENEEDVYNNNSADVFDEVAADSDTGGNVLESGDSVTNGHVIAGKAITASGAIKLLNSNIKAIIRR